MDAGPPGNPPDAAEQPRRPQEGGDRAVLAEENHNNYCANTNTRGIDLNRNFGATWNTTGGQGSSGSACNLTYPRPDRRVRARDAGHRNYIRSLWPDQRGPGQNDPAPANTAGMHLDIHSYRPAGAVALGRNHGGGAQWRGDADAGPAAGVFQRLHAPQQSIGLYPTDGTSDGPSYAELGIPSITTELGSAFFESCTTYTNTTKPANLPALIYAARVTRAPYLLPAGPDITALALGSDASGAGVAAGSVVGLTASSTDTRFNNSNGTEAVQIISAAEYTVDTRPGTRPPCQSR